MAERVVIDPLTRIEGHLRIELETDGQSITTAWSEATQFRGIEEIVHGRDPRDVWAFTQRICGVCTSVHAIASIVAVENAIGATPPVQARLIRDMVLGSQEIQDHVIHFYHLHALDWVDVASIATYAGDDLPAKALAFAQQIGSTWKGNTVERFAEVQATVKSIVASGQLSVFTGGYWGHPAYKLPPEANLMAVAHYLDALEFQRSMIRIGTVFGGKNPHPNFLVGGMACTIDPERSESINQVQLDQIKVWIDETVAFVNDCYVPDGKAILSVYPEYFSIGAAQPVFMAVGRSGATYGGNPRDSRVTSLHNDIKPGVVTLDGDTATVADFDPTKISEEIASAWYTYDGDKTALTPDQGETNPQYTGPKPPYAPAVPAAEGGAFLSDSKDGKYTWCKAPRYDGQAVQVGPLARVMLAYARHDDDTVTIVDDAARTLGITLGQLNSTAGRTLARAVEAATSAQKLSQTFDAFRANIEKGDINVFDSTRWEPSSWPSGAASGYSFVEVARGNLSHWVTIEDGKVSHYQAVVPTTWLAGGRDDKGNQGPYEQSLAGGGHPLVDPAQPLEALRTIHSFDPCMSCAVHVLDPQGEQLGVVTS